ncbi:DNA-3-methyladenine glycosylase I [Ilumatobacter nonamiensis]|uniref:DNA-3-methyladenine glycosylase I n=1 Tax=Ilumatobacter nonamiensis TaxID=467093 RepID=UPI00058B6B0F|nr:DNA-3-methyladenine glycosylase I [Ilumatobacter nonamiensis]
MADATDPVRCGWPTDDPLYLDYHDHEWGRPTTDPTRLFEKICLEGFQSGLSWITILRKRENFRTAFAGFDIEQVARFGESDIDRLLGDAGIIRHRGKIEATINNAQRAVELVDAEGSLVDWIWSWAVTDPERTDDGGIPAVTARSTALSKELKRRGWKFVGPTTAYAFMQSEGLTNDHDDVCFVHAACESERRDFLDNRTLRPT